MAKKYQLVKRVSGLYKIDFNLDFCLSLEQIATVLTADLYQHENDEVTADRVLIDISSKRRAVELMKDYIFSNGLEKASYAVGDNNLEKTERLVSNRLNELWSD